MSDQHQQHEELAAGWALGDLDATELAAASRERIKGQPALSADSVEEFELIAASLATNTKREQLPVLCAGRLKKLARSFEQGSSTAPAPPRTSPFSITDWRLGWLAAAAAVLLAGSIILLNPAPTAPTNNLAATPQDLIDQAGERLIRQDWLATGDPAASNATGEVIWDPQTQQGFMIIEGLATNDPTNLQYQLWIFDADRPIGDLPQFENPDLPILTQRPVDGGVFDVSSQGIAVIPIDAKLPVTDAVAFAVTVEPPGGVVTSNRERVPLLALVGT